MSVVVVAEKPSVARDVALAEPQEMRAEWRRWAAETLPLLPSEWPLLVAQETSAQFAVVKRLINAKDAAEVVCATDAGREEQTL